MERCVGESCAHSPERINVLRVPHCFSQDVLTKIENVRKHYEKIGIGAELANRLIR
jgi:hypothetical protein